jgi:glycosyltransferase involved in cell wall biosynthesis
LDTYLKRRIGKTDAMRVIILSQYYWPEPIPKPHQLATGLRERGHEVVVVTTVPNYPTGKVYEGYRLRPWQREEPDGIQVIRVGAFPDHSQSAVRRTLNYLSFGASAGMLGPLLSGPADAMYVWHPPLTIGLSAWMFSLAHNVPFLYGVHDIWPEMVQATGMLTNRGILAMLSRLESFVYRRAAAIGVISPGFRRNLMDKGVPAEKIHWLPDWADEAVYRPVPPDPALAERLGMAGRFNIVFGGNLGILQSLDVVIEAAGRLRDLPEVQFVLVGDGTERKRLQEMAASLGVRNVQFIPPQPPTQMPWIFALAQGLLVHLKRDPLFELSIPAKTMAYLACGRPILMAVAGDATELIQRAHAGVTCPNGDPEAMAEAVRQLYRMTPDCRQAMGENGLRTFRKEFSREVVVARHEEVLLEIAERALIRRKSRQRERVPSDRSLLV